MTLDQILTRYQDGTLANEPDLALFDVLVQVSMYIDWLSQHPEYKGSALPDLNLLRKLYDFLDHLLSVRYGCND